MTIKNILRTSDLARAVGVHPNTVRLYEQWGFLPPVPRAPNGYRRFTARHLEQMRLARAAMGVTLLGGEIRRTALEMVRRGAAGDLGGALEQAYRLLAQVQAERAQAEAAAEFLQRWARGASVDATESSLRIGQVAGLLNTTIDALRNWERNGLIRVPRAPGNGYRRYTAHEIGRLRVIRMLVRSKYSLMSILRMLLKLDGGQVNGLRQVLDTPRPDEDALAANDRWLSTLAAAEQDALQAISLLEETLRAHRDE